VKRDFFGVRRLALAFAAASRRTPYSFPKSNPSPEHLPQIEKDLGEAQEEILK